MATPTSSMLMEAMAAARAGDRAHARDLLSRLLRGDSTNVEVWLWMSSVVDSPREKAYCLESAFRLDPTNRAALRGLVLLGARSPEEAEKVPALRLPRRGTPAYTATPRRGPSTFNWALVGASALGLVLVIGVGSVLVRLIRPFALSIAPTLPPLSPTLSSELPGVATSTPIPIETRIQRTPIPTELAGTPLAFFVPATPTSTAFLGLTPHPSFEAYGSAVAALQRGDYDQALIFLDQVLELESDRPDVHYLRGEAFRLQGRLGPAIQSYDRAVILDANYAPAYLGRGRVLLQTRPGSLPTDFDKAISLDPLLADAYLAQAAYYSDARLWKTVQDTLAGAIQAGVREPMVYIRLSEAQINSENYTEALESAIVGSANDPTLLQGYLAVGSSYVELEQFGQALWPLQTYVAYAPQDHRGWGYLGRAQLGSAQVQPALESLNHSLALNNRYAPAYLARGFAYVALGDGQAALNDFLQARRYGRESFFLDLGFARAWNLVGEFSEALRNANKAIEGSPDDRHRAEAYAARALIYESPDPPLIDDAVYTWRVLLTFADAAPETRALAEAHLLEWTGEGPTRTPTSTPTPTPPDTATPPPGLTPSGSPPALGTATPTATVTPSPSPTPTPTATPKPPGQTPI
ncbi:MAG: tetratricopeptide repeat protein [Anaerolineales bacterium]